MTTASPCRYALAAISAALAAGCGSVPAGEHAPTARMLTDAPLDGDRSGDMRLEALALIEARDQAPPAGQMPAQSVPLVVRLASFGPHDVPAQVRVWRRGLDGSTASCAGRVDVIALERYVKGVLPHEWIRSWHVESLKAGAVAIRTYASWWVNAGGKYQCADVDDTTASQVYKDETYPRTNAAVDATAGMFVVRSGDLVFAEYSAENGHPTLDGVADPLCAGETRRGHGRGTCQWGSQRWASEAGKGSAWIATHYYPGASVVQARPPGGDEALVIDSNNANNDPSVGYIDVSDAWIASAATPGYYGTGYYYASTASISDPAQFLFSLPQSATKTVEAWWTAGSNRSSAAPFLLYDSSGAHLETVRVDQTRNGQQWTELGTWQFSAGWNKVMLSRWAASGAVVIADAVRVR